MLPWQQSSARSSVNLLSAKDRKKKQAAPYTAAKDQSKWERNYQERYNSCGGHMRPEVYPGMEHDYNGQVIERHDGYTPCASDEDA